MSGQHADSPHGVRFTAPAAAITIIMLWRPDRLISPNFVNA